MNALFMKQQRLSKQIHKNFNTYKAAVLKMNRQELFDHAMEITAYQITYQYMNHVEQYDEPSLDYLLKFENPLEVVVDHYKRNQCVDLHTVTALICDTQDLLNHDPMCGKMEG